LDLSITKRDLDGVAVLHLKGRLVRGEECNLLREEITALLAANQKKILLDMKEVARVDSCGIGVLVETVILAAKAGGRQKLLHVPRLLHNSLVIHSLLQAFDVYDTEEAALASFERELAAGGGA
jgi:anti-sigma B factor antagonist